MPRKTRARRRALAGRRFSNTWFEEDTEPIWQENIKPAWPGPVRYLEVGVCEGRSMLWMLENLDVIEAIGVDPWIPPREQQAEAFATYRENAYHNLAEPLASGLLKLIEEPSARALPPLVDRKKRFDLIYIDGDHRAPEAMLDMQLAWQVLRPNGWLIIDDLQRCWHNGRPLVYFAAQAFELLYKGRAWREWAIKRQICFRKLRGRHGG